MTEKLWISLPSNEETALKEVINSITNKNLTNLSINQLIEKLENNQAADWLVVLGQYNSIPSINNMDVSNEEVLGRARSVRNKFDIKNLEDQILYPDLKNKILDPNQLLSLVILCYSNPSLIAPELCKALNKNDVAAIKHEILENSARVEDRVAPWASNLRLANYALYANDTTVRLPVDVINRVKNETIQKRLTVHIDDQRGGFDEWVNGTERAAIREKRKTTGSEIDTYAVLQSLKSEEAIGDPEEDIYSTLYSDDRGYYLDTPASLNYRNGNSLFIASSSGQPSLQTSNNAAMSQLSGALVAGVVLANTPILGPVIRNICRDVRSSVTFFSQKFFSDEKPTEQNDERQPLLRSTN